MSSYRIQRGDTLSALASRFGTTVSALARANHLANPNVIVAGRTLKIPDGFDASAHHAPVSHPAPAAPHKPAPHKPAPHKPAPHKPTPHRPTPHKPAPHAGSAGPKKPVGAPAGVEPKGVAARYAYYEQLVKSHGGTFRTKPGQMNLVGYRTQTNTHANGGQGKYDDKLVAVWRDAKGRPHIRSLKYNTEPAAAMGRYSNDVNGDGVADPGRVPAGYHEYRTSSWKHGFCLRSSSDFRVERDMNHDGRFTEHRTTGGGASMLFHQGGNYGTGSAGCQTFPPDQWRRFMELVKGAKGPIGYTLLNG